mmetsp:Transcript_23086/g.48377  ORF Transcript_23086/g.48377 Transcript_23086/m.48377 type:complete len:254 (-) Transcript_23086:457-1218(-)
MVQVVDYGTVPARKLEDRRQGSMNIKLVLTALAATCALAFCVTIAVFREDEGTVTLAAMNAQEMRDLLSNAKHMSTAQLQAAVSELESEKHGKSARTISLVASEDTAANPMGGVLENVPATIVAPVPGPPDFNGASAVVARLPNIGFAPSLLEEKGFESRGTFTVRQSRAGESFYLRIYGKLNHNIRCTVRGYRNLMGDFTGNTVYTGFKLIYNGKSQIQTGHIPRGITGEFDIMTCRDMGNGEVQYFRMRYD